MTGFKSSFFAFFFLFLFISEAIAQEQIYAIPPVQLLPLKKMETNSYGIIVADSNDILNESVWKNTTFPLIEKKFSQVPDALPAKAEELRLKLLKLTADAPQGSASQAFITLKLQALFERGQFDDVYTLMQKIPEKSRTEEQNKIYADILLTQELQRACLLADQINSDRFSVICAASDQDEDKAFMALNLLKEQKNADPFIINAAEHLLYQKQLTEKPETVTPLTAAVWRRCGKSLTELKNAENPVWFKSMFVQDESIPVNKRLAFAEELVQKGLLQPSLLRTFYQQASFNGIKNSAMPEELKRAKAVQQAAELSGSIQDNQKKQNLIRQGMKSAEKDRITYAFSNAIKDILETLKPDVDTLEQSADIIKAFNLAGLHKQALDWYKKAEILFPVSETTAGGWYFAELSEPDITAHLFLPTLENMMTYGKKNKRMNKSYTAKIDRLMLTFQTMNMIQSDESWTYSFAKGSAEDGFIHSSAKKLASKSPVGSSVLDALRKMDGTYVGLLNSLSILTKSGLNKEAAEIAAQSADLILN